jgi:hypothetical protein
MTLNAAVPALEFPCVPNLVMLPCVLWTMLKCEVADPIKDEREQANQNGAVAFENLVEECNVGLGQITIGEAAVVFFLETGNADGAEDFIGMGEF